jgi:hypothetical protein
VRNGTGRLKFVLLCSPFLNTPFDTPLILSHILSFIPVDVMFGVTTCSAGAEFEQRVTMSPVGGASALVTYVHLCFLCCSSDSESARVTFICILSTLRTQNLTFNVQTRLHTLQPYHFGGDGVLTRTEIGKSLHLLHLLSNTHFSFLSSCPT